MSASKFYAAVESDGTIVSEITTSPDTVMFTSQTAFVMEISVSIADEVFRKEMLASEKKRDATHTRILYGHLTDEDLWYGASTGLEAKNPITGNWVTIWDISQ